MHMAGTQPILSQSLKSGCSQGMTLSETANKEANRPALQEPPSTLTEQKQPHQPPGMQQGIVWRFGCFHILPDI